MKTWYEKSENGYIRVTSNEPPPPWALDHDPTRTRPWPCCSLRMVESESRPCYICEGCGYSVSALELVQNGVGGYDRTPKGKIVNITKPMSDFSDTLRKLKKVFNGVLDPEDIDQESFDRAAKAMEEEEPKPGTDYLKFQHTEPNQNEDGTITGPDGKKRFL
ncbi:MAG: hypothetical protein GY906_28460 [bacterium]|nr:hypothetical protein [bacterium]